MGRRKRTWLTPSLAALTLAVGPPMRGARAGELVVAAPASKAPLITELSRHLKKGAAPLKARAAVCASALDQLREGKAQAALCETAADEPGGAAAGLVRKPIALDAVALIVHPERGRQVHNLVRRQVRGIFFDGSIQEWRKLNPTLLGGIHVYVVEAAASDVAAAFAREVAVAGADTFAPGATVLKSEAELVEAVAHDVDGIGFTTLSSLRPGVTALGYGADWAYVAEAKPEAIAGRKYKLLLADALFTREGSRDLTRALTDLLMATAGQDALKANGLVPTFGSP